MPAPRTSALATAGGSDVRSVLRFRGMFRPRLEWLRPYVLLVTGELKRKLCFEAFVSDNRIYQTHQFGRGQTGKFLLLRLQAHDGVTLSKGKTTS